MKKKLTSCDEGSVLMIALLTITILTLLCATSLYITSQNANATTQATSWEQAMSGAEAAVDHAMNALNSGSWTTAGPNGELWYTITSSSLPGPSAGSSPPPWAFGQPAPSPSVAATAAPSSGKYNYYKSSFALQGEASNTVTWWVTVDDGSVAPTPSPSPGLRSGGQQAYRIRATAVVGAPGPARVSNNKLDNDLRQVSLAYNRLNAYDTSSVAMTRYAARRIEVVATPVAQGPKGITMSSGINMSGGSTADSFNSNNGSQNWNITLRDPLNPPVMSIVNNTWSQTDLGNQYVYGGVTYSGTTVKDTANVEGSISTPYPYGAPSPAPTPPTGVSYTVYTGNSSNPPAGTSGVFTAGNGGSTAYYQINGDLTTSNSGSGQYIYIQKHDNAGDKIVISVTGNLLEQGAGYIVVDPGVQVTFYVAGNITFQGSSMINGVPNGLNGGTPPTTTNYAGNMVIYGTGDSSSTFTQSGQTTFAGVIDAPNYTMKVQGGQAEYTGAIIGNKITISGGASYHYDESMNGGSGGNMFAFSRWFEDNSDPKRGVIY